jgi:predicted Zn-dependent protease
VGVLVSNEPLEVLAGRSEQADGSSAQRLVSTRRRSRIYLALRVLLLSAIIVPLVLFRDPLAILYRQSRARMLLDKRHDFAALEPLRTALRNDLENPKTLLLLARAHRRLGNLPRVSLLLNRAETLGGDARRIEHERRLVLAQSGRLTEVEPFLPDMLLNPDEDGPDICQAFVQGYFANLRSGDAVRLLDVWQQSYPNDPQVYFMRAYLMQSMDDTKQAGELYRQGLELAPDQTVMRRRLAEVLLETGKLDDAESELSLCVEQAPEDAEISFVLAQSAYKRGDLEVATQRLSETLQRAPDHFEARRLKGQLDLAQGKLDEALQELQAVVRQRPYDLLAREALGRTLRTLGRNDEAKTHFDFVTEGEQANSRVSRLIRKSIENPADAEVRYEIGTFLQRYGPPEDAVRWMRSVLELQPDHPGAHRALADYCESQGDVAGAALHRPRAATDRQKP